MAPDGSLLSHDHRQGAPPGAQRAALAMTSFTHRLRHLAPHTCMLLTLLAEALCYFVLCLRPSAALTAEHLFRRKPLWVRFRNAVLRHGV
jgi:hypothetical protein